MNAANYPQTMPDPAEAPLLIPEKKRRAARRVLLGWAALLGSMLLVHWLSPQLTPEGWELSMIVLGLVMMAASFLPALWKRWRASRA